MKERIITALALATIFVYGIFQSAEFLQLLVSLILIIAAYEVFDAKRRDTKLYVLVFPVFFVLLSGLLGPQYYVSVIGVMMITMFALAVFDDAFHYDHVTYFITMITLLIVAHAGVDDVLSKGKMLFLYVLIATYMTDTFALLGGKFFGKRPLIKRISPKKTVEGAISGYVASALASLTFGLIFLKDTNPYLIVTASLLIPFVSQIGDLAFSLIKRKFEIKDFGKIFPGHGGVLDRVDSLIFSLITFSVLMQLFAIF